MQYKNEKDRNDFEKIHNKLKKLLTHLDETTKLLFKKEIIITSLFRKKENDSGIHETGRAADIRTENYFTDAEIKVILGLINNTVMYDPERPEMKVAIYHTVEKSTWHIHLQVHENTEIK